MAVAASGGRDSTALLHCTAHAARGLGIEVLALHVHHGLHPAADRWQRHLRAQCTRWRRAGLPVTLQVRRLAGQPGPGESVEAWARDRRYRALAEMADALGIDAVLLAQHRRDQAETLLLQALRGAGPAGLAAMPVRAERAGVVWLRPWLKQPRDAIEAYLTRHRLSYVDDASNDDDRFARNRLRQQVWPALQSAFDDAERTLAQSAARAQEAAACLQLLAVDDAVKVIVDDAIVVAPWLHLSAPQRANLLRHWRPGPAWPDTLVQRLLSELPGAQAAQWPAPGGLLRLHRGILQWVPSPNARAAFRQPVQLDLQRPGCYLLADGQGSVEVKRVARDGIMPGRLRQAWLRPRSGGERFQLAANGTPRSLKKQFQQQEVPAWARGGPLLWSAEGQLLYVPGLGIDARMRAPAGSVQLGLQWRPAADD